MDFFRLNKNQRGFTLTEIVVAAGLMGVLAIVLLQITKDQTKTQVKGEIDNALAQVQQEILSIVTSPAHCNANFAKLATSTTPASLRTLAPDPTPVLQKCNVATAAACRAVPVSPYSDRIKRFPVYHAPTWGAYEWTEGYTKISTRVRISGLTYEVDSAPGMPPGNGSGQGDGTLRNLKLNVTFQIKTLKGIETVTKTFNTVVVVNGTSVNGCPRSANSTSLF